MLTAIQVTCYGFYDTINIMVLEIYGYSSIGAAAPVLLSHLSLACLCFNSIFMVSHKRGKADRQASDSRPQSRLAKKDKKNKSKKEKKQKNNKEAINWQSNENEQKAKQQLLCWFWHMRMIMLAGLNCAQLFDILSKPGYKRQRNKFGWCKPLFMFD